MVCDDSERVKELRVIVGRACGLYVGAAYLGGV